MAGNDKSKVKSQKSKVTEATAPEQRPVPTFTLRADRPGDLAALIAMARVVDRHDVHAAVREFELYVADTE